MNTQIKQERDMPCSLQLIPPQQENHLRSTRRHGGPSVNNFIQKTYSILQERRFESIISWSEDSYNPHYSGVCAFKIHNLKAFQEIVLPQYFKHSNMSSFVRQLNMYNFHKVRRDKNQIEFQHQKFSRNKPELLSQIKRKQVDSANSIPSIALIMHSQPVIQEHDDSTPIKRFPIKEVPESLDRSKGEQELADYLAQLQQKNRTLKRNKQNKAIQLRQLTTQNKQAISHKFNKCIMSLIAFRIAECQSKAIKQSRSLSGMNMMIQHIMDNSRPKLFKQYMKQFDRILKINPNEDNINN